MLQIRSRPVQKVKRAAPGGEGNVLDPFSALAIDHYLAGFDRRSGFKRPAAAAQFHDSFEYYGANWTPTSSRSSQRPPRLRPARAAARSSSATGPRHRRRVKCDYRETIADLHLAYIQRWTEWCHAHGWKLAESGPRRARRTCSTLYAAADIPEMEVYGDVDRAAGADA
jgi:hypothetical protein